MISYMDMSNEVKEYYNNIFKIENIKIEIEEDYSTVKPDFYKITEIKYDGKDSNISENIKNCNKQLQNHYNRDYKWSLFYLYKELIQILKDKKYTYYRGQGHNYELFPGILRNDISDEYRKNFEQIYKELDLEFPNYIEYFEGKGENKDKRLYNLAKLQHYGLPTSLLDITSNPYIAMLFMLQSEYKYSNIPTLYCFKIDENNCKLFDKSRKDVRNERIDAQHGAFLNFDKLYIDKKLSISPIEVIKIELHTNRDNIDNDIEKNQFFKMIIDKLIKNNSSNENFDFEEIINEREKELRTIIRNKERMLRKVRVELIKKLEEYNYFEENLFPDFESKLKYTSNKYKANKRKEAINPEIFE